MIHVKEHDGNEIVLSWRGPVHEPPRRVTIMICEKVHDKPSDVESAEGLVLVSGPDGVAVTLTPEAALITGTRLIESAAKAVGDEQFENDIKRRANQRK